MDELKDTELETIKELSKKVSIQTTTAMVEGLKEVGAAPEMKTHTDCMVGCTAGCGVGCYVGCATSIGTQLYAAGGMGLSVGGGAASYVHD